MVQLAALAAILLATAALAAMLLANYHMNQDAERHRGERRLLMEQAAERQAALNALMETMRAGQRTRDAARAAAIAAFGRPADAFGLYEAERRERVERFRRLYMNNLADQAHPADVENFLAQTGLRPLAWRIGTRLTDIDAPPNHIEWDSRPNHIEWEKANKRAAQLLLEVLSPGQRKQWQEHGYFAVLGSHGGVYRVDFLESQFLGQLKDGTVGRFCLQPVDRWTPFPDRMIAWKVLIEADEMGFLRTANMFPPEPYFQAPHIPGYFKAMVKELEMGDTLARVEAPKVS